MIEAFPLCWPMGYGRTDSAKRSYSQLTAILMNNLIF
jgi:hypothetical protein